MPWLFCVTAGPTLVQNLPSAVQTLCESWNNIHTNEFPNIGSWVSHSGPDVVWVQLHELLGMGQGVALSQVQGSDVCVSLPSATPLPTTLSLQRATSAPCRPPTWAPSAARACPWQLPSSTPCCPWSGSPGISSCKSGLVLHSVLPTLLDALLCVLQGWQQTVSVQHPLLVLT